MEINVVCLQGMNCEYDIDECERMPCQHGGTCHDLVAGFRCSCPHGTKGMLCEIDEVDCSPEACHHGGTCVEQVRVAYKLYRAYIIGSYPAFMKLNVHRGYSKPAEHYHKITAEIMEGLSSHFNEHFYNITYKTYDPRSVSLHDNDSVYVLFVSGITFKNTVH